MSYQMIHDAVTEAVENVPQCPAFSIGDKVKYRLICHYREDGKYRHEAFHEAVVVGFTEKTIKIAFPNGYTKNARPDQIEKI